ncbi:MAG: metal ABC transporter permease [Breznakia sp.]
MFSIFQETFMMNALILGMALAITAALLSPFLVLSNQAMIADGLSHVAFTGMIVGFLCSEQPLYFAIPFVVVASFAITALSDKVKINNDAAISVVASFSLAIGLIIATVSSGFNRSIESLLVGSILSVSYTDIVYVLLLLGFTILFVYFQYRSLLSMTFDFDYATFSKVHTMLLRYSLSAISALFVVIGVRSVGTLLISAFMVFPALIASLVCVSFKRVLIFGIVVSMLSVFFGMVVAYYLGYPTGSSIVVVFTLGLLVAYLVKVVKGKKVI